MALECSVVVPVCNEEQNLPTLHVRLTATLRRLAVPYEVIYVDDGSTDRTAELVKELQRQDPSIKAVSLSRNFGHQAALCAGLEAATGRAVVTIDGDLQDPPELIPELIEKWREGFQVVYARRRRRREHPVKRACCFIFYRGLRRISDVPIALDTGDFALMDRRAVDELNNLPERTRFVRGLRGWIGFRQTEVYYDRDVRGAGRSKYPLERLMRLGMDGVLAFSSAPLKAIGLGGAVVSTVTTGGLAAAALVTWLEAFEVTGLHWLGLGLGWLAGLQLISLGVLGAYLGRIHEEVRGRPLYVTRERTGFNPMPRVVPNVLDFLPSETARRQEFATTSRLESNWPSPLAIRDEED